MIEEKIGRHSSVSDGRCLRFRKIPFEVPPRIKDAGRGFGIIRRRDWKGFREERLRSENRMV
jgi:hypothetical protein